MELLAIYRDYFSIELMWLAVAVLAFIVKIFTREYISLSVGIAALITFVAANTFFTGNLSKQMITFFVAVIVIALFIQPYAIRKNEERRIRQAMEKNVPFFQQTGTVIEEINNMKATGKISIDGTEQMARSATGIIHKPGEQVRVVDHDRTILLVV